MNSVIFSPSLPDAFAQAGMQYPETESGNFDRFSTNGKPLDKAGYLRKFPDGKGAVFGCWRSGTSFVWQQRTEGAPKPSVDEIKHAKAQAAQVQKQAEHERDELYQRTAKSLLDERAGLPIATHEHSYLKRKGILLHGDVRIGLKSQLNIPVFDGDGNLQSVQDIFPDGRKQFAKDAKMKGGRFVFGELADGEPITLTEGYATGASVYESGIGAVACCFSGSNLAVVAADLRKRYPNSFIRIAGDLDANGKGAEFAKAAEAEAMPNAETVLPIFSDGRDHGDFNDLHQFAGLVEVRRELDRVGRAVVDLNDEGEANPHDNAPVFDVPALPVADARDGTLSTRPLSEYGNAQRLSDLHGEKLRFIPEIKSWLVWRDDAWHGDTSGALVQSLAGSLPKLIYTEGATFDMVQADHFAKHARISQKARTIDAAVSLLSVQEKIRLALAMIDSDQMLIGFNNARQVIDLRNGRARAATQADYITKSLTPCNIGDAAKAVRWLAFLEQVFDGDMELIDWLHRWCGYLLTGSTQEQIFLFLFGLGANGKSVFAELLKYVLGDYSRTLANETLTEGKRQAGSASPDLADLLGCRMALSSETSDGCALAETLIKSITGGDTIVARQMYKGFFQYIPAFKLVMTGNHRPIVHGTDHGFWRRIRLVPFNRTFSEQERDPKLLDKLKAESPHILAWMVQGCLEWQRQGLTDVPKVVASQTADYRTSQDLIGMWLSENTNANNQAEITSTELYSNYEFWAKQNGLKPCANIALGRRMAERGFVLRQSHGKRIWCGISLNTNSHASYSNDY
jgi:P4 family phage/plasmid primase-like protien